MKSKPIVWSIAGSDSGGGAGIQADILTFHDYAVHPCTVITASTAQNTQGVSHIEPLSSNHVLAQMASLKTDLPPRAIKLGMLYDASLIQCIAAALKDIPAEIVADPVMVATCGDALYLDNLVAAYQQLLFPMITLLTPNVSEASHLTGIPIRSYDDMETAAHVLRGMGVHAVLIKGGDFADPEVASDFFCDAEQSWWINQSRIKSAHTHGTGCTLSAAIAAGVAQGWSLTDAIVLAKAYVHAGITVPSGAGSGQQGIGHVGLSQLSAHFPWVTDSPRALPAPFKPICDAIGRYPIVDNLVALEALCVKGIRTIQLRIKNSTDATVSLFEEAKRITQSYGVDLFINDYWDIARDLQVPGIHLGQEDVRPAPLECFDRNNIKLGISAHNLLELAQAYAYHPSYLTMGPVFPTQSKKMAYAAIGMDKLRFIAQLSPLPLVAIGGISHEQCQSVLNGGCSGVAFINASKQLMRDGRYDRHLSLPHFTASTQKQLANARIVCVGMGGLASGALPYLVGAGIGKMTLVDYDTVSLSNLQRQTLFSESDLGEVKVSAAAKRLKSLNACVDVVSVRAMVIEKNARALLQGHDVIIDATDNFDAHYLLNDVARALKIPLVAASVLREHGHLFYISPDSGCYRCLFPLRAECPSCDEAGVLGVVPGMLGLMQAKCVIDMLAGRLDATKSICRVIDLQRWTMNTFEIPNIPVCSCATETSIAAVSS